MNDLIQGSPEWLEFRKDKIGASDSPIIMGVSPWKTPYELWLEKLGISSPETFTQAEGKRKEPIARKKLEYETGLHFMPDVRTHPDYDWMIASLDAIDISEKVIAEIKCPGKEDHTTAKEGKIPDKYFPQMQHQLEVCNLEWGYYYSFDGENGILLKIYRDDAYIKEMIQKDKEFWDCIQSMEAPKLTDRDYIPKIDEEWRYEAAKWLQIHSALETLEKREKEVRDNLIRLSDNHNAQGAGVRVSKIVRKGNIDYSQIPELKNINLDAYRKKPIESWRILKD